MNARPRRHWHSPTRPPRSADALTLACGASDSMAVARSSKQHPEQFLDHDAAKARQRPEMTILSTLRSRPNAAQSDRQLTITAIAVGRRTTRPMPPGRMTTQTLAAPRGPE